MKGELHQKHLDFFNKAKIAFEENDLAETYMNEDESLIALRFGIDRDCINVFKLDGQVAFLHNVMSPRPKTNEEPKEYFISED